MCPVLAGTRLTMKKTKVCDCAVLCVCAAGDGFFVAAAAYRRLAEFLYSRHCRHLTAVLLGTEHRGTTPVALSRQVSSIRSSRSSRSSSSSSSGLFFRRNAFKGTALVGHHCSRSSLCCWAQRDCSSGTLQTDKQGLHLVLHSGHHTVLL
jgi:hypothetical protein